MISNWLLISFNLKQCRVIRRTFYNCADETVDAVGSSELDKLIKVQNDEYYALYDALAKNLKKKEQIEILDLNFQLIPDTKCEVNMTKLPGVVPSKQNSDNSNDLISTALSFSFI